MTDLNKLRETIEDWPNMFSDGKTNFIPVRDVLDLIDGAADQMITEIACCKLAKWLLHDQEVAELEQYEQGLEDAWECVLKIGKLDVEQQKSIFGTYTTRQIALSFTVQQAMQKIMDYEERQTERACSNCFYERLDADKDPCKYCGTLSEGHTNWRPKVKKEKNTERKIINICDKCAKTKCSVKMQLEEQNIKLESCHFYEDKESE